MRWSINCQKFDKELYGQYVVEEKGECIVYMELLKALYGTLQAMRLFWEIWQSKLIDKWNFIPNRYDICVVNKVVNGKQLTVAWHVNDLKVTHVDKKLVEKFIKNMSPLPYVI